jgi:hypothetical protein
LPVFDICGFGSTFPTATSSCDVQHCALTFISWYDDNFEQCQNDLRGFGGDDSDIAALSVFVDTCRAVDISAPAPPACDPIFLGPSIGFHNVFVRRMLCSLIGMMKLHLTTGCLNARRSITTKMAAAIFPWLSWLLCAAYTMPNV